MIKISQKRQSARGRAMAYMQTRSQTYPKGAQLQLTD